MIRARRSVPSASNPIVGLSPTSGDHNADGDNYDYPNVTSYQQATLKEALLGGLIRRRVDTGKALDLSLLRFVEIVGGPRKHSSERG